MLLGLDILNILAAKIDLSTKILSWDGGSLPLFTDRERQPNVSQAQECQSCVGCTFERDELVDSKRNWDRGKQTSSEILLSRCLTISPESQVVARVSLNERPTSEFMWFQLHSHMKVCVANSVHKNSKTTSLNFLNPIRLFITLKKHTPIGVMHSLNRDEAVAQFSKLISLDFQMVYMLVVIFHEVVRHSSDCTTPHFVLLCLVLPVNAPRRVIY